MINLPGQLAIQTVHGKYGPFKVGHLKTPVCVFSVKDPELDQYDDGKYDGVFVIGKIFQASYNANGRSVTEIRAKLAGMTLSNADELSSEEARTLAPQEVDPVDEESPAPAPAQPTAPARAKPRDPRDPLVDITPFGEEPAPLSQDAEDEALFGHLWPLTDAVVLDTTVDRLTFRRQCGRLKALNYHFAEISQEWRRAA
jgi:hypothetical protein